MLLVNDKTVYGIQAVKDKMEETLSAPESPSVEDKVEQYLQVDPIEIEIGYG